MKVVKFRGKNTVINESKFKINDDLPFLTLFDEQNNEVKIGMSQGKKILISVLPTLNDNIVSHQIVNNDKIIARLKDNLECIVVTMDNPAKFKEFLPMEKIKHIKILSDYKKRELVDSLGLLAVGGAIKGLCARAILVINENGRLIYKDVLDEITALPDYNSVLETIGYRTKEDERENAKLNENGLIDRREKNQNQTA